MTLRPTAAAAVLALAAAASPASASTAGPYSVTVLVDGVPAPEYAARGRIYLEALRGRNFSVRLSNPTSERVAVALSVDGRNVIDARRTTAEKATKWILMPGQTAEIPGWQVSGEVSRRFFFTETARSYAKWLGDTANVGTIEAVFYRERRPRRRRADLARAAAGPNRDAAEESEARPAPPSPEGSRAASTAVLRPSRGRAEMHNDGTVAPSEARPLRRVPPTKESDSYAATGIGDRTRFPVQWISFDEDPTPRRARRCDMSSAPSSFGSACFLARTTCMPEIGDAVSSGSTLPTRTATAERSPDLPDDRLIAPRPVGRGGGVLGVRRRHTATVHRWMARAVGEQEADDMTQDVLLKAYRGLPRFRDEAPPRAWLASIADNAVKNRYRARGRFRRIFAGSSDDDAAPDAAAPSAGPEENARASESRAFVTEALKRLPAEFRMPVVLRDLEEWSYEEIAVSLDLPVGTVKSRIARGRGQLRDAARPPARLEGDNHEPKSASRPIARVSVAPPRRRALAAERAHFESHRAHCAGVPPRRRRVRSGALALSLEPPLAGGSGSVRPHPPQAAVRAAAASAVTSGRRSESICAGPGHSPPRSSPRSGPPSSAGEKPPNAPSPPQPRFRSSSSRAGASPPVRSRPRAERPRRRRRAPGRERLFSRRKRPEPSRRKAEPRKKCGRRVRQRRPCRPRRCPPERRSASSSTAKERDASAPSDRLDSGARTMAKYNR